MNHMPITSGHCAYQKPGYLDIAETKETLASPLSVVSAKRPFPGRTLRYRNTAKI
jgi:hypothetical protein